MELALRIRNGCGITKCVKSDFQMAVLNLIQKVIVKIQPDNTIEQDKLTTALSQTCCII